MRSLPFLHRWLIAAASGLAALSLVTLPDWVQAQEEAESRVVDLTDAERAWLAEHPVIRVGAETNYAPYEFQDSNGHFIGVVADYLNLIRQRLDAEFEVHQLLDFPAVESQLRLRGLDVVLALTPTAEREQFLAFTKPYLHYVNVVVTRDDFGFVTGLRDFEDQRIAVVAGHSSQQLVARAYPGYEVTAYSDLLDALMAVSTGKEAGLVDDIFPIVFTIRDRQINNLKIATPIERALQPKGFSIAVRSDWPELVSILEKVLLTITQEEQHKISQKWLAVRYESKVDYTAIWMALAVFSTILLASFFWIRMLNRQRKALVAARSAAEAANRAKDEFLASMSHELRTPLHAILGYADLLRVGGLGQDGRKDALDTIAGSGRHLLALINDLLDLSRIRAGHLELTLSPVHLRALLDELVAMVRVDARNKGLAFTLEVPDDLPEAVLADDKRLRQILLNLLGNAIKFTDTGKVVLSVQCALLAGDRIKLRFTVEDTGVGIAPEDHERIFAPFEQADQGQRRESGVGLGLAISQEFARLMGGLIEVESRPGGGSRFHFTSAFPVIEAEQVERAVLAPVVGYEGPRRRILIVDDQEENRKLVRQMLEPLGFDVALASDGLEAVDVAQRAHPDLVLMDLRMPVMNGFDSAAAIRRLSGLEKVAIVAASASSADLARAEADPETFGKSLRKPFQTETLLETIANALGLSWRHTAAQAELEREPEIGGTGLVLPPPETLEELVELVRLGKLVRVEQIAADLEQRDARLRPFARQLIALARGFEEDRLLTLLHDGVGTTQDAASH